MRNKKGQSSLEYVIILTAIIAAVIVGVIFIAGNPTDSVDVRKTKGLGKLMDKATDRITDATGRLPGVAAPEAPEAGG